MHREPSPFTRCCRLSVPVTEGPLPPADSVPFRDDRLEAAAVDDLFGGAWLRSQEALRHHAAAAWPKEDASFLGAAEWASPRLVKTHGSRGASAPLNFCLLTAAPSASTRAPLTPRSGISYRDWNLPRLAQASTGFFHALGRFA